MRGSSKVDRHSGDQESGLEFVGHQHHRKVIKKNLNSHSKILTSQKNQKLLNSYNMGLVVKDVLNKRPNLIWATANNTTSQRDDSAKARTEATSSFAM